MLATGLGMLTELQKALPLSKAIILSGEKPKEAVSLQPLSVSKAKQWAWSSCSHSQEQLLSTSF